MSYDGIAKALYDYEAQDPETELSLKEDDVLYIIDKEDDQWWKAKLKPAEDTESEDKVGLVPANYVEEIPPISYARALYDYTPTSVDELALTEESLYAVFELGPEWNLVRLHSDDPSSAGKIGFVPANYVEAVDSSEAGESGGGVMGGQVKELDVDASAPMSPGGAAYVSPSERVAASAANGGPKEKDEVETWSVSILDKKGKKKKGTLGVGNGSVFFASESDKTPVQQFPISTLQSHSQPSSKTLVMNFSSSSEGPLTFHCGSKDTSDAISTKLDNSKRIFAAGGGSSPAAPGGVPFAAIKTRLPPRQDSDEEDEDDEEGGAGGAAAKNVRWAPTPSPTTPVGGGGFLPPPTRTVSASSVPKVSPTPTPAPAAAAPAGGKAATALYDFDAQGEDELSVKEGESLTVLDDSNDDWWSVKNASGSQGVVPAQYVELGSAAPAAPASSATPSPTPTPPPAPVYHEEESLSGDDTAAIASAGAAQAARDAEKRKAEKEKARAKAAAARAAAEAEAEEEREREEEEERERLEAERARRERKAHRRAEEERRRREEESARRREAARQGGPPEPPVLRPRPSANDVNAARLLPSGKGKAAPDRPSGDLAGKSRPNPDRTRVWHDKSGQFRVEAEFLGLGNGKIRLHKLNGVVIEVPLEKMSPEDVSFIKKYQRRAAENRAREAEDNLPLAQVVQSRPQASAESVGRASPNLPQTSRAPAQAARPRKPPFDWFEFFLSAGCDLDDCTRYARNFEKDKIDEDILPDIETSTLRSLGLREGDVIRVRKAINARNPKHPPEKADQIKKDEEFARQLQAEENAGRGGNSSPAPGTLFTNADGKLANNTRRGRPEKKVTSGSVDTSGIAAASEQLNRQPSPPLLPPSPPPAPAAAVMAPTPAEPKLIEGFDDAWVPQPVSNKPTTPQPGAQNNGLTNQFSGITLNQPKAQPNSSNFEFLSQIGQNQTGGSGFSNTPPPQGFSNGLGMGSNPNSMGAILHAQQTGFQQQQQQQQQQPQQVQSPQDQTRGPLAPVPANQGLLNPLIPTSTGFNGFVPTRGSPNPMGMQPMQTGFGGMMPQQTGFMGQQGYGQQQGFAGPQQPQSPQYMQPNMTGYTPQTTPVFNAFASVPTQQPAAPTETNKFQPANIFAQMKQNASKQDEAPAPQQAEKYDALRPQQTGFMQPLTTGYNGGMMQQPTGMMGMMPQQTGYMPQQGLYGGQPLYGQQTGFPGQQQPNGYRQY